jgi:hypothetical protein
MPEYRHPRADADAPGYPPAQVHISRGETAAVTDGTFTAPQSVAEAIARDHDTTASAMRVDGNSDDASGETYYCVGAGGDCSREVDEPGGKCWQHQDDGED